MTVVGLQPISLRDATLTVAEDDFTAAVSEVTFVPEQDYEWLASGFGPTRTPVPSGVRWVVMVSYAQDFATVGGLTRYLIANAGLTRSLVFTPTSGGPVVSCDVLVVPGKMGGVAGEGILAAQVVLPLHGKPVIT